MTFDWNDADPESRRDLLLEVEFAYMRATGVDRAVLHPLDLAWGEQAVARFPDRFAMVPMIGAVDHGGIDPLNPSINDVIGAAAEVRGVVGFRIVRSPEENWLERLRPAIGACVRTGLPLFVLATGELGAVARIAEQSPDTTVVVDHLGLPQPSGPIESPPFRSLPKLLELAARPNVAVKLCGAPALSEGRYPFNDVWPHLERVVDAFGPHRIMWGSDISRFMDRMGFGPRKPGVDGRVFEPSHTYAEALFYLRTTDRLSTRDKELILGGTAQTLLRWPADQHVDQPMAIGLTGLPLPPVISSGATTSSDS